MRLVRVVLVAAALGAAAAAVLPLTVQALYDHDALTTLRSVCSRGCRGVAQRDGSFAFMREADARRVFGDQCSPSSAEPPRKELRRF